MKLLIRYFSLGLFTAGILMLGILLFSDNNKAEDLSTEELIPLLKNEGYHVLSNDEYISLSVNSNAENKTKESNSKEDSKKTEDNKEAKKKEESKEDSKKEDKKQETAKEKNKDEKEDKKKTKSSYTLNIKSGMPTSSISSELEQNGIIENASEFTKYLEEHDFALKVKAKKVEVNSDMSFYELAHALTNY